MTARKTVKKDAESKNGKAISNFIVTSLEINLKENTNISRKGQNVSINTALGSPDLKSVSLS